MGSNIQEPLWQLKTAIEEIRSLSGVCLLKTSSFYQSQPWGNPNQPDFLNAVVGVHTTLTAFQLFEALIQIENHHKRIRTEQWGPRTLDCDILLYGQEVIKTPRLTIPHPRMYERDFVLVPLAEIAPHLTLHKQRSTADDAA